MVNYVETNKAAFGNGNDESDLENVENRKFSKLTTEALIIIGRQQVKATGAYILIVGSLNSSRSASFFFIFRYASNFQVFSKFSTTL